MYRNRTRRTLLAVLGLLALAALITGSALAISQAVLADANTVNDGTFRSHHGAIRLRTEGSVRIRDVQTTGAAPGFSSGWHMHSGPVLVAMSPTSTGSLTIYDDDCEATTIGANQAYIETPNQPVLAVNQSAGNADWVTTMIVPIGVPFTTPVPPPCNP